MDIFKICFTAVVTVFLCVLLKRYNSEYAIACAVCGCCMLIVLASGEIYSLFSVFYSMAEKSGIDSEFITIILKITGIAYIGQFSAGLCRDAGETAIAANVELCTKVLIMAVGMPVVISLFSHLTSIMDVLP